MAIILNIDTAIHTASVCVADDERSLAFAENKERNQHSAWLHTAIGDVLYNAGKLKPADIEAVAVSAGPGSYTGLRIGMAAAKGLCYALNVPLICVGTLHLLAASVKEKAEELVCPMIDARRMEVFTALFDKELNIIEQPKALVLTENSFSDILTNHKVLFTGDGMLKFQKLTNFANANFVDCNASALNMLELSLQKFRNADFDDIAYTEPFYVKAVYTI